MYGFRELPALTGLNESQLKNWLHGRPLRIKPHKIIGRSGIYTDLEVWKFRVVAALSQIGICITKELQPILDQIDRTTVAAIERTKQFTIQRSSGMIVLQFDMQQNATDIP